uniref:Uncharacterized protein n=1 Tax=Anguilla anguilla TaxID=7936 RepID=A0A0E9P5X7_ANGAN
MFDPSVTKGVSQRVTILTEEKLGLPVVSLWSALTAPEWETQENDK